LSGKHLREVAGSINNETLFISERFEQKLEGGNGKEKVIKVVQGEEQYLSSVISAHQALIVPSQAKGLI